MRRRFPAVFPTVHDQCFRFRKDGTATILSDMKFAQCLGRLGSPTAPICYSKEAYTYFGYSPEAGIYEPMTASEVTSRFHDLLEECALGVQLRFREAIRGVQSEYENAPATRLLQGRDIIPDPGKVRDLRFVHVANGVLDLETLELLPFTPDLPSSWKLPVAWKPDPPRPRRFWVMLERLFPDQDDRTLAVEVLSSAFLGNPFQRFVLLAGAAGTGKSTLVGVLATLLGPGASTGFRLAHSGKQFASYSWVGKLLLYEPEVEQAALHSGSIAMIKAITGHDPMVAELKHKNATIAFTPRALPILVTNPKVRLDPGGNRDALSRRLIAFDVPEPSEPFRQETFFAKRLIESEGSGILHLFLSKAHKLRREGRLMDLTDLQECRRDLFLGGSEPLRVWARKHVVSVQGRAVPRDDAIRSAEQWLKRHDFQVPSTATGWSQRLKPVMAELNGVWAHSLGDDRNVKGWRHVTLV